MRKSRVRALHVQAFEAGRDGSLVVSQEFERLKKTYNNPSYAKVVVSDPEKPGFSFLPKYKATRRRIKEKSDIGVIESIRNKFKKK